MDVSAISPSDQSLYILDSCDTDHCNQSQHHPVREKITKNLAGDHSSLDGSSMVSAQIPGEEGFENSLTSYLNAFMLFICFGYYYKLTCGLFFVLGIGDLCYRYVYRIDLNHWAETLFYCPLLWFCLHSVNKIVFTPTSWENAQSKQRAKLELIGECFAALCFYGMGIHANNLVEIYTRTIVGISSGESYALIYFLDEVFSHAIQFYPFFGLIGWYTLHDKLRFTSPKISVVMGVGHGVERAVGVIEGNNWFLAVPVAFWMLFVAFSRSRNFSHNLSLLKRDYFFRHSLSLAGGMIITQIFYFVLFGSLQIQPSEMGMGIWMPYALSFLIVVFGSAMVFYGEYLVENRYWTISMLLPAFGSILLLFLFLAFALSPSPAFSRLMNP